MCVVRLSFLFKHALYAHWLYSIASHSTMVRNNDKLEMVWKKWSLLALMYQPVQTEDIQARPPNCESKMPVTSSERSG